MAGFGIIGMTARNLLQQDQLHSAAAGTGSALLDAVARRDLATLASALAAGETAVMPTPENPVGGSAVGLCVSHSWLEGLRLCREAGANPNRDAMLRDPLIWAYHLDDLAMANELLAMGLDPLGLFPDDRLFGIPPERNADALSEERIAALGDALGEVDRFVLHGLLERRFQPHLRPRIGCVMLNGPRRHSLDIHRAVLAKYPGLAGSPAVAPYLSIGIERLVDNLDLLTATTAQCQLSYARDLEALWGFQGLVDATLGQWPREWNGRPPSPGNVYLWLLPREPNSRPVFGVWDGAGWGADGDTVPAAEAPARFIPLATLSEVTAAAYRHDGEVGSEALAIQVAMALGRLTRPHAVI